MKLLSWNINGINSSIRDGILDFIKKENADIYCFQEVKSNPEKATMSEAIRNGGYTEFWNPAEKKGYSGTLIYSKKKPLAVIHGIGIPEYDKEGRVITLEYEKFILVNAYFPNSQHGLARLGFKLKFNEEFLKFVKALEKDTKKPVIMCGDFNVAHKEIDIAHPKENEKNAGFTIEERNWFTKFLDNGFVDVFRHFSPDKAGQYTWWSYRFNARARNIGWRIDYFAVSREFMKHIKDSHILKDARGSDHAPIVLEIN
ncbi:exodeoxyribonuclease III [Candidatus Pacearchaeota archaeon]|nr:exodeoxyribonuclease III [Candidatus Pacearchaeota archaeon]